MASRWSATSGVEEELEEEANLMVSTLIYSGFVGYQLEWYAARE
jgi:hypothetical protein